MPQPVGYPASGINDRLRAIDAGQDECSGVEPPKWLQAGVATAIRTWIGF